MLLKWIYEFKERSVTCHCGGLASIQSESLRYLLDKMALDQVLSLITPVSPVSIIPPILHTHSLIYRRRCIMFFSQYFSFPCQYHSTNAPYSFTHLPPTLYNVFLPVLQFPLSVSFHQCSILIHSSTTDAV
jgi:hypothetical protein